MAFNFQTPQKPLPGAFLQTPAASRFQTGQDPARQLFRTSSSTASSGPAAQAPTQATRSLTTQPTGQAPTLQPIQYAARTVNEILKRDASFPDLDSYVKQGISSDYELPSPSTDTAWAPYQKSKMYDIPDAIFEQYNRAQVSTMMGLFAELNHAWVSIDNALYLWDYTAPSPELQGFEEQPNSITAVKLVKPRPGVFKPSVTHILVLATTVDIHLLGVESSRGPTGVVSIVLYRTQMSLSVKGLDVRVIEGSITGRIFFGGGDNDVYELKYQQEEKWFLNRCGKVNHTSPGYAPFVPGALWGKAVSEHVVDITIDDSRNLLYVLSSESTIRTFHMDSPSTLRQVIEKKRQECLRDISHMTSQSPLLTNNMRIVSISPISATEASKLHLMATTSTGCRLFLSATRGYGYLPGKSDAPQSMQVQHIKFPPREQPEPKPQQLPRSSSQLTTYQTGEQAIDTQSRALEHSRRGIRYPPGLFLCFISKDTLPGKDILFLSAPDTGRIAAQVRETGSLGAKYFEQALWLNLDSHAEAIGLITKPFAAASTPLGFGNELAVQYDEPPPEIAILTNTGIHTIRRRRLVDIFAAAIRQGGGEEGLDAQMKRFIRQYGRGETTAAALAVACGQGADLSADSRVKVTDPAIMEFARKAFVEFGGKPSLNENAVMEASLQAIDHTRPSARHDGLALYISRLVRSLWTSRIISESYADSVTARSTTIAGGKLIANASLSAVTIKSTVSTSKLIAVQDDISKLDKFLEKNKSFIEGLSGPDGLHRATSKQEEIALQGEHQALHSLQILAKNIIEGISFVMMLFDERVNELWVPLDDTTRQRLRDLTYETLFTSNEGKDLGKILVKAIVNRNIANGSNVDTVADALRRKCSSFCSAGDVIIFKAQEQLKKASQVGINSEANRSMLNESLRLFKEVAEDLSFENLQSAVTEFKDLQFFAGAIELCLVRAEQIDRGRKALNWVNDGRPNFDDRVELFEERRKCYKLIHDILEKVDEVSKKEPEMLDGRLTIIARKRNEAYDVVNLSDDELFHDDLYDWYLTQGWTDRLLAVQSPYIVTYLRRLASTKLEYADLLWRLYANTKHFYDAATVQLDLAKSDFALSLSQRVEYLSMAKANASTNTSGASRQARQVLLHEVSELLEVATIQDELLQRLKSDPRLDADRRQQVLDALNGQITGLTELYNTYAEPASYFDICLLIYQAADYRNTADISATWLNFLNEIHRNTVNGDGSVKPYEAVTTEFMALAPRLNLSETIFPVGAVIEMLERYAFEYATDNPLPWAIDLMSSIDVPYETILSALETMFYNDQAPFHGENRSFLAIHMVYLIQRWYTTCITHNQRIFGSDDNASAICQLLTTLIQNGLDQRTTEDAQIMIRKIEKTLR